MALAHAPAHESGYKRSLAEFRDQRGASEYVREIVSVWRWGVGGCGRGLSAARHFA